MSVTKEDVRTAFKDFQNLEYISESNHELIEEWYHSVWADDKVSPYRIKLVLGRFETLFDKFIDVDLDSEETGRREIRRICGEINASEYDGWSQHNLKTCIRQLYKRKYGEYNVDDRVKEILEAECLQFTKPSGRKEKAVLETPEVRDMADAAMNPRDKFLVELLFEVGPRISEVIGTKPKQKWDLGPMKIGDLDMRKEYIIAHVPTLKKDNHPRQEIREIALTICVESLHDWLNAHPNGDDPEAPLFVNIGNYDNTKPMTHKNLNDRLKALAKRAGIEKRVSSHVFRHSSATYYGTVRDWGTRRLKNHFGWSKGDTADIYCQDNTRQRHKKKLEEEGVELNEEDQQEDVFRNKSCPRCSEPVRPNQNFCGVCSYVLDKESYQSEQKRKQELTETVKERFETSTAQEELLKAIESSSEGEEVSGAW